jgi:hypothetical protein
VGLRVKISALTALKNGRSKRRLKPSCKLKLAPQKSKEVTIGTPGGRGTFSVGLLAFTRFLTVAAPVKV